MPSIAVGEKTRSFDAMGVAAIDVDHSVTIEKCAGF